MLDDSTDQKTRDLVDDKCLEWRERGVNCTCLRRTNRQGYKAGALKEVGMCCPAARALCMPHAGRHSVRRAHSQLDSETGFSQANVMAMCSLLRRLLVPSPSTCTQLLHRASTYDMAYGVSL